MSLASSITTLTVGGLCKTVFKIGLCSVSVSGLSNLTAVLEDGARSNGQGVVTVANHISTLDDPITWGVLPASYYLRSRYTRWTLGASDIIFTNPVFSAFFRLGQTIETFRTFKEKEKGGIYQPAVDTAIEKLDEGGWVHLFGEGKVNQSDAYPLDAHGRIQLPRFRWGVGRILMEARLPPVVIPMWLTGFDRLMPEGRKFPFKYLPRFGQRLSVTFGAPIPTDDLKEVLNADLTRSRKTDDEETVRTRINVTEFLRKEVESLGRRVTEAQEIDKLSA